MNQPPQKKRFLYNKDDMCKALEAVASGMQINTASKKYSVPRTSLYNKAKKIYKSDTPGPSTVLTSKEEEDLVQWVLQMCSLGCPVTKDHLFNSVAVLIKKSKRVNSFTDGRPGRHWFDGFLRRHPVLTQQMSENISLARALVTEDSLKKWFTDVGAYLKEQNLENIDESRIFNTDETALLLNPKGGSVLAAKGSKNVYNVVNNNEKENLTVLVTGNAAGQLAPTLVVFNYQRVPTSIYAKLPPEFHVGTSEKGWMTSELFYEYIANKFYPWVAVSGIQLPVILFLDGHVAHMTQPLSAFCHDHRIILVALPPNTTHLMQPMDVTMFSPLKAHWRKEVNAYRIENHVLSVAKHDFAVLLRSVFTKMDLKTILSNGFSACGLHPFAIDKLDLTKLFIRSTNNYSEPTINQEPSLIQSLEKYINPDTLKQLRACGDVEKWEGQTGDTNLYHVCKSIRADCHKTNVDVCSEINNDNSIESLSGQILHDEPTLQHMDCVTDIEQQNENVPMEVLNPELIVLQNVADAPEVSSNLDLQFSVLNDEGNVYFPLPIDLSEQILLNVDTSSNVRHEHETPEDHVNNENKVCHNSLLENIENSSNVINIQESINIAEISASTSNASTVSQSQQFLYWPIEKTSSKKKRISKVKIPSVMSLEEGLQWYKEQENKKIEVEEAKELKKKIRAQNALIKKEKVEEAKKLKASKNTKKQSKPKKVS